MNKLIKKIVKKFVRSEISTLKKQLKSSEQKIDELCKQIKQLQSILFEVAATVHVYRAS